jgi:hypothetical protein
VGLGQVFCKYLGFPCQFTFHRLLHNHHLSSGASTIGKLVADVPNVLILTPPHPKVLVTGFHLRQPGFDPWSSHVGFVVDKMVLGGGFLCQFSFHQICHTQLSSRAGTIGQLMADVQSGLSLSPPQEIKKRKHISFTCAMVFRACCT